jgi:soluble lytic murein transglycosylase-like protein
LRNIAFTVVCAPLVFFPVRIANASVVERPPPPPNPAEIVRAERIDAIRAELDTRIRNAHEGETARIAEVIVDESKRHGFDPWWVVAVIESESNFDIEAVSPTGARGLMQVIPSTFREVSSAKRMFDPVENVRAGITYLGKLSAAGFRRADYILLAYNQGPKMAMDIVRGLAEPTEEAKGYAPTVMSRYQKLLKKTGRDPRAAWKLFKE